MGKRNKEVKEEKIEQLDLGIKEPFKNKFFKIKGKFDATVLRFEVKKFLKDPLIWANVTVNTVLIAQQVYLIYKNIEDLPAYLPIFKYFISIPSKLVTKEFIIIFPIISVSVLLLSLIFASRCYNNEKILTKFLLFASLLCVLAQSIILIDLVKFF